MKTGTIIAVSAAAIGAGTLGYLYFRSRRATDIINAPGDPTYPQTQPNLLQTGQQIVSTVKDVLQTFKPAADPNWENKIVRVNRREVYLVKDGLMRYISHLPLQDGRGFDQRVEVGSPILPIGPPLTKAEGLTGLSGFGFCFN